MPRIHLSARGIGIAAVFLASASPAFAQSETDRARMAITEAEAKIEAAVKIGAVGDAPRLVTEAQASLRAAHEELASSRENGAIIEAHDGRIRAAPREDGGTEFLFTLPKATEEI